MSKRTKLTKNITEEEFVKGYWYAAEIKSFAKELGIANSSKLRKDELEQLIRHYIRTGEVKNSNRKNVLKKGIKDLEKGLKLSLPIINYTSNKQTKQFIKTAANKLVPGQKIKSGVWYRLNRWRDEQITKGVGITYGDLVHQFVKLNSTDTKFERVEVGRYINFIADYLANEKEVSQHEAIEEWKKLKDINVEKNYKAWKRHQEQ